MVDSNSLRTNQEEEEGGARPDDDNDDDGKVLAPAAIALVLILIPTPTSASITAGELLLPLAVSPWFPLVVDMVVDGG